MENDGWTGLAIINIGDEQAAVMLGAYGENGVKVFFIIKANDET